MLMSKPTLINVMELQDFTSFADSDQSVMITDSHQQYVIRSSSAEAILTVQTLISRLSVCGYRASVGTAAC